MKKIMLYITIILIVTFLVKAFDVPTDPPGIDPSSEITNDATTNDVSTQITDTSNGNLDGEYLTQSEIYQLITQNSLSREEVKQIINERMENFSPASNTGPYIFNLVLLFGLIGVFVYALHVGSMSSKSVHEFQPKLHPLKPFNQPLQVRKIKSKFREGPAFDAMVEYVKKHKDQPGLKNKLIKTGWSFDEVNEAFKRAE